ncbi:MAG TPA: ABC transporter permease, partial [Roseovarius sp.]|nr:ABC transporter permease [Roseovarius sp.]
PVAYYIAKMARGRVRSALFLLCLVPFWVSELVRTFGWMILLRETGLFSSVLQWAGLADAPVEMLYNDAAIMVGLVYTSMLFMVVPLITTLDSLDDAVIEAGYDLGGSGPSILREIVIPHAMPGIVSGSIVVFMLSLGNYLTPIMLGGKDSLWFTELIYSQFIVRFNWELGAAFGFMLLILSSVIVWGTLRLTGQTLEKTMG